MFTWTETPLADMWNHLRYLESPANVARLLSGEIKSRRQNILPRSSDLDKRSYEIASCVRQADEYYRAAETVGLAVHPLLQFYGAEALAKASILANDPGIWLSDISYHGLSTRPATRDLQQYTADPDSWELEQEFAVKKANGVFPHLCTSVGDTVPANNEVFIFKDLLRVIPELDQLFHRHYGELSNCRSIYSGPKEDQDGHIEIYFNSNIADVRSLFPEFNGNFEQREMHSGAEGFRSTSAGGDPLSFGAIERGTVAGRYFVRPLSNSLHKSFSVLFAAMFVLSNVVRYKPAFWMGQLEGIQSGSASVAEALCNLAKRRLPNDALEGIWQEGFTYGTPAYVG